MSYARLTEVKLDLGIAYDSTADDALLQAYLDEATTAIDTYTGRTFEAETETRYFEYGALDDGGLTLVVDRDLLTVTTLTNGDDGATVIPSTEYWLVPRNSSPKHGIRLKADSTYQWEQDTDYWIGVLGTWGYSATPPRDVVRACKRLAMYYYAQKDAHVFDVTAVPEAGVITVPQGIPRDVERILGPYLRVGLA